MGWCLGVYDFTWRHIFITFFRKEMNLMAIQYDEGLALDWNHACSKRGEPTCEIKKIWIRVYLTRDVCMHCTMKRLTMLLIRWYCNVFLRVLQIG